MGNKDMTLQVLESAIAKCGQAVLDGTMSVREYEEATGRSGDELKTQIETAARSEFGRAVEAIKGQMLAATQAVFDRLKKAGLEEAMIKDILGQVETEDDAVTAPDWSKVTQ